MLLLCVLLLFSLFWSQGSYPVFSFCDYRFHTLAFSLLSLFSALMELLSWKNTNQLKTRSVSYEALKDRCAGFYCVCSLQLGYDADQHWEDLSWHRAGGAGVSHCPAPGICLLLSPPRAAERCLGPPFTLLFATGGTQGACSNYL